ncbi:MAG: phosphate ABC transporter permease PstA, partial [Propionibacteriaceae bacterium]|nr:phosphate ABC transporter permease PstA [Propionibacteriaceae bacterium]
IGAVIASGLLLYLLGFILIRGLPHLKPELFAWTYTSDNVSLLPALLSTLMITGLTLVLAVPLGVITAIWLTEYARSGSRFVRLVGLMTDTLAGIPSIVYGLFGLLCFVTWLGWGFSLTAGAVTLGIMILPLIIRSTEEALRAVPGGYREAALSLGAGRLRTVGRIILPAASGGIMAGVILAVGRIIGESAALIYTAGTVAQVPTSGGDSARTLSVHLYALSSEGLHTDAAYATAVVLTVVVVIINAVAATVAHRFSQVNP